MAIAFTLVGILAAIGLAVFSLSSPSGVRKAKEPAGDSNAESKPAVGVTANTPEAVARAYLETGDRTRLLALLTQQARTKAEEFEKGHDTRSLVETINPAQSYRNASIEIFRTGQDEKGQTFVLARLPIKAAPGMPRRNSKSSSVQAVLAQPLPLAVIMRQEADQWRIYAIVEAVFENTKSVEFNMEKWEPSLSFNLPKAGG